MKEKFMSKDNNGIYSHELDDVLNYMVDILVNEFPTDIFTICYDYVFGGCKSRRDYEYMVNFLIDREDDRRELLK